MTTIAKPGTSYTQYNSGVPSDRFLNKAFDQAAADGTKVDGVEVVKVLQKAVDGGQVTQSERNSIKMALDAKMLTPAAEKIATTFLASDAAKDGWETRRANMKTEFDKIAQGEPDRQQASQSMISAMQGKISEQS